MIYVKAHTGSIYQLDGPDKDDNYVLTYLYQTVPNNEKPFIYKGKQLKDCTEFKLCQILTFEEMIQELKKLLANFKNEFPDWPKEIVKALQEETVQIQEAFREHIMWPEEKIEETVYKGKEGKMVFMDESHNINKKDFENLKKYFDEEPEIEW